MGLGIIYAIAGGIVWGFVPPLVKRGLVHSDVDAAVTVQQLAMVAFLLMVWIVGYGAGGQPIPAGGGDLRHPGSHRRIF